MGQALCLSSPLVLGCKNWRHIHGWGFGPTLAHFLLSFPVAREPGRVSAGSIGGKSLAKRFSFVSVRGGGELLPAPSMKEAMPHDAQRSVPGSRAPQAHRLLRQILQVGTRQSSRSPARSDGKITASFSQGRRPCTPAWQSLPGTKRRGASLGKKGGCSSMAGSSTSAVSEGQYPFFRSHSAEEKWGQESKVYPAVLSRHRRDSAPPRLVLAYHSDFMNKNEK